MDALLGTGGRGAPRGFLADVIAWINHIAKPTCVVSVDIPSGVDSDTGHVEGEAVQAHWVYTMGLPKVGHVLPPGQAYGRKLVVLDIGFPKDLLQEAESEAQLLTSHDINTWFPRRKESTYKGKEGHLLIIAGSEGMTGAALLCAKAAVTLGAGLVTTVCPKSLLPIYANGLWEMMTLPVQETDSRSISAGAFDEIVGGDFKYDAVVVGPGLGRHPSTMKLVQRLLIELDVPVLFDGDALFELNPDVLKARNAPWVVTPHTGEMARIFGVGASEIESDRWEYAQRLANHQHGVAILKGPNTVVAGYQAPLRINSTGSSAMASGGMGDSLAGLIGALLAKGLKPLDAASIGVFLHGLSADDLVETRKLETVSANQVIEHIPYALNRVRHEGG